MAEYSKLARGSFVTASTPLAQVINLPFQPTDIALTCVTSYSAPAQYSTTRAYWDVAMGQGVAAQEYISASSFPWVEAADWVASGGISTFAAGQLLQYGPLQLLGASGGAGIAKTSATVLTVTTSAANTTVPGDWIVFQNLYQTSTTGMQQIAGIPFQVQAANWSTTSFQIAWLGNASNLTAITTAATGACGYKKILYPTLYEPGEAFPYTITVSAGVGTVTCTAPHNFQVGQEVAFRIPSVYGAQNLNTLPNSSTPGSPQYYYVSSVTSATQFTIANAPALSSAFVVNATFASFPGLGFAQVVAVGDVNTGGVVYSGGNLYPSPLVNTTLSAASTINGPAILGSYINNTSQGFIIGLGVGAAAAANTASAPLLTASSTYIWEAKFSDLG